MALRVWLNLRCYRDDIFKNKPVPVFGSVGAWSRFNWLSFYVQLSSGWMQWAVIHLGRVPNPAASIAKREARRASGNLFPAGRCSNLVKLCTFSLFYFKSTKEMTSCCIYILFYAKVSILCDWTLKKNPQTPCTRIQRSELRPGLWFLTRATLCLLS